MEHQETARPKVLSRGAATKGDFEKSSGELVFTDGENFQSITVTVYDDVGVRFSASRTSINCEDGVDATSRRRDAVVRE